MIITGMKNWMNTYYSELEESIGNADSLLDVGCGEQSPLFFLKNRVRHSVGVDGFQKSLEISRKKNIHDDYLCCDILGIKNEFEKNSFNCVVALDVIEHLPKEKGFELVEQMEFISSDKVIIFTPNGFLPQAEHSDNIMQKHISGWSVNEMKDLGYEVIGINGWKPLLGELAIPKFQPKKLWAVISRLSQPIVRNNPELAFQILCVKDMNASKGP